MAPLTLVPVFNSISGVFAFLLSILTTDLVGVEHIGPAFGFSVMIQGIGASIGTPAGGKFRLVVLGLTALWDNISIYIGPSPKEREKEEKG